MDKLFSEFKSLTTNEWIETIKKDLKGKDIEKLNRITLDGLKILPFYTKENTENIVTTDILPQKFPFIRGNKKNNQWQIRHDFKFNNLDTALKDIDFAKTRNADIVGFDFGDGTKINKNNISAILEKANELAFTTDIFSEKLFYIVKELSPTKQMFLNNDPVSQKTFTGGFDIEEQKLWTIVADMLSNDTQNIKPIGINIKHFANAGATAVQQLAFGLAIATEYFDFATEMHIPLEKVAKNIYFNFAFGTEYFMEISKVRAFRYLFAKFIEAYDKEFAKQHTAYIHGVTARRNKTIYDAYVNMLRTTIETHAAVVGGVDSFSVEPFDTVFANADDFSNRIAINQQIVIKEEAFADKVVDVAGGSYYVENITYKLIEEAWKLFLEIQGKGGFCDALKQNYIYDIVKEVAEKEKQKVDTGKITILGTNKYPNRTETLKNLTINKPSEISDYKLQEPQFKTLKISRLSEDFEQIRMGVEKFEKQPKVFLLTFGNASMRRARADFAGNFFAAAGFDIVDNLGFADAEKALETIDETNPEIIVLCSSDDEYLDFATQIYDKIKNKIVVIAGSPKSKEDFEALGITNFISVKSNIYTELKNYINLLK